MLFNSFHKMTILIFFIWISVILKWQEVKINEKKTWKISFVKNLNETSKSGIVFCVIRKVNKKANFLLLMIPILRFIDNDFYISTGNIKSINKTALVYFFLNIESSDWWNNMVFWYTGTWNVDYKKGFFCATSNLIGMRICPKSSLHKHNHKSYAPYCTSLISKLWAKTTEHSNTKKMVHVLWKSKCLN